MFVIIVLATLERVFETEWGNMEYRKQLIDKIIEKLSNVKSIEVLEKIYTFVSEWTK